MARLKTQVFRTESLACILGGSSFLVGNALATTFGVLGKRKRREREKERVREEERERDRQTDRQTDRDVNLVSSHEHRPSISEACQTHELPAMYFSAKQNVTYGTQNTLESLITSKPAQQSNTFTYPPTSLIASSWFCQRESKRQETLRREQIRRHGTQVRFSRFTVWRTA